MNSCLTSPTFEEKIKKNKWEKDFFWLNYGFPFETLRVSDCISAYLKMQCPL